MLPVVWLETAMTDLAQIISYIASKNPAAARQLKERLKAAPLPLSTHPYLYPDGRIPGTRELVAHPNYIVVYQVTAAQIEIMRVLHARQKYP